MVCPKLKKGDCMISSNACSQSYMKKMIMFKSCPIFKKGKMKKPKMMSKKKKVMKRKSKKRKK